MLLYHFYPFVPDHFLSSQRESPKGTSDLATLAPALPRPWGDQLITSVGGAGTWVGTGICSSVALALFFLMISVILANFGFFSAVFESLMKFGRLFQFFGATFWMFRSWFATMSTHGKLVQPAVVAFPAASHCLSSKSNKTHETKILWLCHFYVRGS